MFHGALIVFSALQVHETRDALVPCTLPQCFNDNGWLWSKVKPFLIVVPCIVAVSWLSLIFWIKQLFGEFGWDVFLFNRVPETSLQLDGSYSMLSGQALRWSVGDLHVTNLYRWLTLRAIAMYQFYQIFICLLKFDFFCFVGVTMQVCTPFLFMWISIGHWWYFNSSLSLSLPLTLPSLDSPLLLSLWSLAW